MKSPSRAPATLAVGFLVLDALLLALAGVLGARPLLIVLAAACALAALFVVILWRRYRRTYFELDAARQDVQREIASIRELLQSRPPHQ